MAGLSALEALVVARKQLSGCSVPVGHGASILRPMADDDIAPEPGDVTCRLNSGMSGAQVELSDVMYRQLKDMAHRRLKQEYGHRTLSTTALVHEAWLEIGGNGLWESREHFFRYAATTMRHILVDRARRRLADKRGGRNEQVTLSTGEMPGLDSAEDILGLHSALEKLASDDARLAEVVELRFFAGLSVPDTAAVLGISERSVVRDWQVARLVIHRELERDHAG